MTYDAIIKEVSSSLGLSLTLTDKAYRAYWKAVREHVVSLPLKEDLSDEEFLRLQPNVNIPSIGKLYVTLDRYHNVKKHHNYVEEKNNNRITKK